MELVESHGTAHEIRRTSWNHSAPRGYLVEPPIERCEIFGPRMS